jgi:hypothetical protein
MTIAELLHKLLFPRPAYGVWIAGVGWLRGANGQPFVDTHKHIARSVARRLGIQARVEFIDNALSDATIEHKLLNMED